MSNYPFRIYEQVTMRNSKDCDDYEDFAVTDEVGKALGDSNGKGESSWLGDGECGGIPASHHQGSVHTQGEG